MSSKKCSKILIILNNVRQMHTTQITLRSKKPFYNQYFKQYRPRGTINQATMVHEFLDRKVRQAEEGYIPEEEEEDFEKALLKEAKRKYKQRNFALKMKEFTKGSGPRMLTWEQSEQLRFLQQSDPERWDVPSLAHAFQISNLVVKKILHSKKVIPPEKREMIDAKALEYQRSLQTQSLVAISDTKKDSTEDKSLVIREGANNNSIVLENKWFNNFNTSKIAMKSLPSEYETNNLNEVSWIEDNDKDFYEMIYGEYSDSQQEIIDSSLEESEEEEETVEFSVQTDDGEEYFDNMGNFLYRVM